jgi:hypothetical protein
MLRGARAAEKTFRREQSLQTEELTRIARARKVVADKRRLRATKLNQDSLLASYQAFKLAKLKYIELGEARRFRVNGAFSCWVSPLPLILSPLNTPF